MKAKVKILPSFSLGLVLCSMTAWAENTPVKGIDTVSNPIEQQKSNWVDKQHDGISKGVDRIAEKMDGWFGAPDPNNPATATLRILVDTEWNKYDDFSVKPRIRGRVKLPVLERKLSVVFGDDELDNQMADNAHLGKDGLQNNDPDKTFNGSRTRENNSSLALRWSDISRLTGLDTDFDIGIRSGDDLYARVKAGKNWQLANNYTTSVEQIYRYGIDSEHYARTNFEIRKAPPGKPFIANHLHTQYTHTDGNEAWSWGNSLYRQHDLAPGKWFNYGLYAGGPIKSKKADINSYGPFAGYRQPIYRDWLYAQTEVNYYNDRSAKRDHHIGALFRLEALF
ncbi:hypothetical protein [Neisseria sp. S1]|uniref:hypothetical protein n=1 Tax=Neisseria sp. S1 TaxID=3318354 RepID=UPI003A84A9F7